MALPDAKRPLPLPEGVVPGAVRARSVCGPW